MNVSSKVPARFNGQTLLEYLSNRFSYLSAASWQQLVREGRIFFNAVISDGTDIVSQGDIIRCELPDFTPPEVNLDYSIVYEDEWLLGINKPAGLRVHSGGKFVNANLIYHLRQVHCPPYPEVDAVHRLDADTSGLVLLARDKTVLKELGRQFAEGQVAKRYLAVVEGCPRPVDGNIALPIGPVTGAKVPRFWIDSAEGKTARTQYKTVRKLSDNYTLLELQPETGRTHQLRVHLAAVGHPIVGDGLYTMKDDDYLDWRQNPPPQASLRRQALHCLQMQFIHPIHQTVCTLSAPLATDIERFLQDVTEDDG